MADGLKESGSAVEKLVAGVSTGLDNTRASLATIARLEAVGRNIEKIVAGISLVVVQTTMLAVSGSVEAARAGEHGPRLRGGVERHPQPRPRGLRQRRQDQGDGGRHPRADRLAAPRPRADRRFRRGRGPEQPLRAGAPSRRSSREVAALGSANDAILQGADAILSAAVETAAGARQIAAAAEEASAAARQASTASTEQARGAEDLAAAIEEIASLADTLKQQNA